MGGKGERKGWKSKRVVVAVIVSLGVVAWGAHYAASYQARPAEQMFTGPLGDSTCDLDQSRPQPGFYATCKNSWSRHPIKAIGEDLIVYEAARPTSNKRKASARPF